MIGKMSATTADVVLGTPPSEVDSPLFHNKLMAADTTIPTMDRLAAITELLAEVEAEYAATDKAIADAAKTVWRSLSRIADPSLYVLDEPKP